MEFEQLITLIKTVSDSKVTSVTYEKDNEKITIKSGDNKKPEIQIVPAPMMSSSQVVPQPVQVVSHQAAAENVETSGVQVSQDIKEADSGLKIVNSPLVGTFYAAASPEDEPFVKVGDVVRKGQKIGIIEAMKLMNDIESEFDGEIVEILVSNENMVEYGQPLFKIK